MAEMIGGINQKYQSDRLAEPKKVFKKWDELRDVKLTTPLQKKRNSISS
jgi:hypothetical protein